MLEYENKKCDSSSFGSRQVKCQINLHFDVKFSLDV